MDKVEPKSDLNEPKLHFSKGTVNENNRNEMIKNEA